jgi:hypothetical protein
LLHHTLDHALDQVAELLLQKHVEIITLVLHDPCEIQSHQSLKVLRHVHGTFGMFRTFQCLGRIRDTQTFASAECLQGLQADQRRLAGSSTGRRLESTVSNGSIQPAR